MQVWSWLDKLVDTGIGILFSIIGSGIEYLAPDVQITSGVLSLHTRCAVVVGTCEDIVSCVSAALDDTGDLGWADVLALYTNGLVEELGCAQKLFARRGCLVKNSMVGWGGTLH